MISLKRILAGVAISVLWAAACVVVLAPVGCATLEGAARVSPDARRLVAELATVGYIRQAPTPQARAARAAGVRLVVAELQEAAAGEPLTVQRLAQLALERIPSHLLPEEKLLAVELINRLQSGFTESIGHGGIESDSLVRLSDLLAAVDLAASFYATG